MHEFNFLRLIVRHIVGELKQHRIVSGARLLEQLVDHLQRAFVVGDHERQKLTIKASCRGIGQRFNLLGRCHAKHCVVLVIAWWWVERFASARQPLLHKGDFVPLRGFNSGRNVQNRG